jgi:hypothetical protein
MGISRWTPFGLLCALAVFACGSRSELDAIDDDTGLTGAPAGDAGANANRGTDGGAPGEDGLCAPARSQDCQGSPGLASKDAGGTMGHVPDAADGDSALEASSPGSTDDETSDAGQVLYTGCSTLGALDCSSQDRKIRLLCDGMTWNPIGVCSGQQVCDSQPGPDHGLCTGPDAGGQAATGGHSPSGGVVLYTTCSTLGATDCSSQDPAIQVLCDGMTWGPIGVCSGQQVCDSLPGPDQGLCKDR